MVVWQTEKNHVEKPRGQMNDEGGGCVVSLCWGESGWGQEQCNVDDECWGDDRIIGADSSKTANPTLVAVLLV
ncbi:hypothetical protein Tco_0259873 [Tanacetum coccineum]